MTVKVVSFNLGRSCVSVKIIIGFVCAIGGSGLRARDERTPLAGARPIPLSQEMQMEALHHVTELKHYRHST